MTQDFKPLFQYFDEKFSLLSSDISILKEDIRQIKSTLDTVLKTVKGFEEEMIVNRHRIDRLEQWARQVSEKTGIPLPF